MKIEKGKKRERTEQTILGAAHDFCAADSDVQKARRQWREIHSLHDPYDGVCFLPIDGPEDEGFAKRPTLPRSQWCEDCCRFISEAVDYQYALHRRRQAKVRMIRAYKKLNQIKP